MTIYEQQGYSDREQYLESLAEDYGLDLELVTAAADILGPNEDFDGLVTTIQDEADRLWQ